MPPLTARDKRTIRYAAVGIAIYLVAFIGFKSWRKIESNRKDYTQLIARVAHEQQQIRDYENKVLLFEKLSELYRIDPRKLPKETLAAEASAAIQNAARQGGFKLGPFRETPGRSGGRELTSIQFDGIGPLPAALTLIHNLQTLGYPLVIDSLQLTQDPTKPGMLKVNATVVLLNFETWKKETPPNA
jgi:hypothetical protein